MAMWSDGASHHLTSCLQLSQDIGTRLRIRAESPEMLAYEEQYNRVVALDPAFHMRPLEGEGTQRMLEKGVHPVSLHLPSLI